MLFHTENFCIPVYITALKRNVNFKVSMKILPSFMQKFFSFGELCPRSRFGTLSMDQPQVFAQTPMKAYVPALAMQSQC
jgi:hypothetical protein